MQRRSFIELKHKNIVDKNSFKYNCIDGKESQRYKGKKMTCVNIKKKVAARVLVEVGEDVKDYSQGRGP